MTKVSVSNLDGDVAKLFMEIMGSLGTELVIFAITACFAIAVRLYSSRQKPTKKQTQDAPKPEQSDAARQRAGGRPRTWPENQAQSFKAVTNSLHPAARLINEIVECVRSQQKTQLASYTLLLYKEVSEILAAEDLKVPEVARLAKYGALDLYTALMQSAIASGEYDTVQVLLDDMISHGVARPLSFYESIMKQAAGLRLHSLALQVYDRLEADGLQASAVTCSCLIGFAAEVGELDRAVSFFEMLSRTTTPSIRAYMTILRVHAKQKNWRASVALMHDMTRSGVKPDALVLNIILATGVAAADDLQEVFEVLAEADQRAPPITDIVSYNTLMKGYAQRADSAAATRLLERLIDRGLEPNAITMNTAMDAAVRGGSQKDAWALLQKMRNFGIKPDKFTCSILVKSPLKTKDREPTSLKAERISKCLALLEEVDLSREQSLRSFLYSSVLDSAAQLPESGNMVSKEVHAAMRRCGVSPSQTPKPTFSKGNRSFGS